MDSMLATDRLALVDLTGQGHYLSWGIIQISYANAIVILTMIAVFVLALFLPFPGRHPEGASETRHGATDLTSPEGQQS